VGARSFKSIEWDRRTHGCVNRCRRFANDWENLNRNAVALLKLASIMLWKLCNP
jgi:hypothetical protein